MVFDGKAETLKSIDNMIDNMIDALIDRNREWELPEPGCITVSVYKDLANALDFTHGQVYRLVNEIPVTVVVHHDKRFAGEILINAWENESNLT